MGLGRHLLLDIRVMTRLDPRLPSVEDDLLVRREHVPCDDRLLLQHVTLQRGQLLLGGSRRDGHGVIEEEFELTRI